MSSSDTLTYDQSPPHRPALSELGGGAKVNEQPEPDPVRQLRAEDVNQASKQLAALARVTPIAVLQVDQTAGTYSKTAVSGQPAAALLAAFTVTKNGTGDVTVSWTAGLFPSPIARHRAHVVGATPLIVATEYVSATSARVRLYAHDGTPQNSAFDLDIF